MTTNPRPRAKRTPSVKSKAEAPDIDTPVLVIGAGFAGICAAIQLQERGIDFVVVERESEVGGTWWVNSYPGCAVDVPSMLYSYSFEQNPDWTRVFCRRDELHAYANTVVDRHALRPHIRLGTDIVKGAFDQAAHRWGFTAADGTTISAQFVIAGLGPLNRPLIPNIPGRDTFAGDQWHSMRWDHDVDLAGKRVISIGTGASAVQFVPPVAEVAGHLTVVQRSAPWLMPKLDHSIGPVERFLFRQVPGLQRGIRELMFWGSELFHKAQMHPQTLRVAEAICLAQLRFQVRDGELRRKLTPDYTFGCKRPMVSSNFYPALTRPNVDLETRRIIEIVPTGVVLEDGTRLDADVIIWGTGFKVQDAYDDLDFAGRGGVSIPDLFRSAGGMEAYYGTTIHSVPNLFLVLGPNSGLGHTSAILSIEAMVGANVRLVADALARGISRVEAPERAQREWTKHAHDYLASGVWTTGGCTSYFIDDDGVNRAAYPGSARDQQRRMAALTLEDYDCA